MTIYFYSNRDQPYGAFSNFAKYGVDLDGEWWLTTEHYFQAQKFSDPEYIEKIRLATSPKIAADLGRSRSVPLRLDWERVKDDLMFKAVLCKFRTYPQYVSTATRTAPGNRR